MRISDWSSDVCSSDLHPGRGYAPQQGGKEVSGNGVAVVTGAARGIGRAALTRLAQRGMTVVGIDCDAGALGTMLSEVEPGKGRTASRTADVTRQRDLETTLTSIAEERSEEHTSELQSLMRISYAVLCLKKKTTKTIQ